MSLDRKLRAMCNQDVFENVQNRRTLERWAQISARYSVWMARAKGNTLGISCGSDDFRNYLMMMLSANAVLEYRKRTNEPSTILELGSGVGINFIAAKLADPEVKYVGYEGTKSTAEASKAYRYLVQEILGYDEIEIRQDDFLTAEIDFKADIVISENISKMLLTEPQVKASRSILPHTHEGTLFVPGGVDVYFKIGQDYYSFGRIDFSQPNSHITLEHRFEPGELQPNPRLEYSFILDLLDFNQRRIFKHRDVNLRTLPLSTPCYLDTSQVDPKKGYNLKVCLFEESQDIEITLS